TNSGWRRFTCWTALLKTPLRWPPVRSETMANWNWSGATFGASDVQGFFASDVTANLETLAVSEGVSRCAVATTAAAVRHPTAGSRARTRRMADGLLGKGRSIGPRDEAPGQ